MKQLFLILLLSAFCYSQTKAQDCKPPSVKEAVKFARNIVVGKVIGNKKLYLAKKKFPNDSIKQQYYQNQYTVKVSVVYKGKRKQDTITITTGMGKWDGGFSFEIGKDYIIYTTPHKYKMSGKSLGWYRGTSDCSRTCLLNDKEIAAIEQYRKPKKRK